MHIIIVGAGLAGLSTAISLSHSSTGHKILLLESAPQLAEVGAGVQLTPVATRQFLRWGLGPSLLAAAAVPENWLLRRGSDGEVLNCVPMRKLEGVYGAPYIVVHRADLHRILHEHAVNRGVEFRLNSRVVEYGFEEGWLRLDNGEKLEADLVVACDGINSTARELFLKENEGAGQDWLEKTGWAAYRAMADVEDVKSDPLTKEIVAEHAGNCWADADKSIMTYMVRDSEKLNLVISHPDDIDTSKWTREQSYAELTRLTADMDPRVRRLIELVNSPINNWPVFQVRTLPRWISNSGKFVLIGDAVHAMAFYLSMGVSLAVEDAAALTFALELHTSSSSSVPLSKAMSLFERIRKSRAEAVRDASLHAGKMLHIPPGKDREIRDAAARNDGLNDDIKGLSFLTEWKSYGITDKTIRDWCYGYDVEKAIKDLPLEESLP
ncbi:salicylate hydroxylase [Corynespora cassiicola Philippines]|uniref:Salicylate hydroxylase n=1 Tax=Corynespora cassiicola Philippines TaxID=1448308 RepID=A0A2T2N1R7_CORCC|nr:salicylate hydroxylase [Corynespora cassiicola Philippines]